MDSSHLEDEALDDTILTDDATSLMRKKPPSYVVNIASLLQVMTYLMSHSRT